MCTTFCSGKRGGGGGSKKKQGEVKAKDEILLEGEVSLLCVRRILELRKVQEQPASVLIELVLGIDQPPNLLSSWLIVFFF